MTVYTVPSPGHTHPFLEKVFRAVVVWGRTREIRKWLAGKWQVQWHPCSDSAPSTAEGGLGTAMATCPCWRAPGCSLSARPESFHRSFTLVRVCVVFGIRQFISLLGSLEPLAHLWDETRIRPRCGLGLESRLGALSHPTPRGHKSFWPCSLGSPHQCSE